MRNVYLAIGCFLLFGMGCNNSSTSAGGGSNDSTSTKPAIAIEAARSKLDEGGTQLLLATVNHYYALKNALVAAKAPDADSAATKLIAVADSLKGYLQKDSTNGSALKPFVDTVIGASKLILAVTDETCERKRLPFGPLSSAMFGMLKTVDLKHAGIYREYCPMAYNEKGATWLSDDPEIKNPYFGKKMLECGEVTDSLK